MGARFTFGESMGSRFISLFDVPGTVLENVYSRGHTTCLAMSCLSGLFDPHYLHRYRCYMFCPCGNIIPDDQKRSRASCSTTGLLFILVRGEKIRRFR